jgi:formate dehydrogenase subunit beta
MGFCGAIEVKEGRVGEALDSFFHMLLEAEPSPGREADEDARWLPVDSILVPQEGPVGTSVNQSLISRADFLRAGAALAPVMPVNSATLVKELTRRNPGGRIAVFLRPCEIRALVELAKLKQAALDNLLIIGMDCYGTYSVSDFSRLAEDGVQTFTADFLARATGGEALEFEGVELRRACRMCEYPTPVLADIKVLLFGADPAKELLLWAEGGKGEKVLRTLGLTEREIPAGREKVVANLLAGRTAFRDAVLAEREAESAEPNGLIRLLANCIACHNCREVCPVCYCRECTFDTPATEHEPDVYMAWARKRGRIKMPADTLFFHLVRMSHIGLCCVGCGMCTEACPNDIPVAELFRIAAREFQEVFEYLPGRDPEEPLPLSTFKEQELEPR